MQPLSLYVHIPFCRHKCHYCDFNTYAGLDHLIPPYLAALEQELDNWAGLLTEWEVRTIFFGGVAVISIAVAHRLDGWVIAQLFALLSGAVFFLGGLHLDRRTLWPGVLLICGAAAVDHIQPWPWTTVGLATSAALVASALWMKPRDEEAVTAG